jgi:hypothetical protein
MVTGSPYRGLGLRLGVLRVADKIRDVCDKTFGGHPTARDRVLLVDLNPPEVPGHEVNRTVLDPFPGGVLSGFKHKPSGSGSGEGEDSK